MSVRNTDRMRHFAFMLRSADPKAYEAFLAAFDDLALEKAKDCVAASADKVLNWQGQAAQTFDLLEMMRNPKQLPPNIQPAAS